MQEQPTTQPVVPQPHPYQVALLRGLQSKHIYAGTVSGAVTMTAPTFAHLRRPGHVFADEVVVGMRVVPPGRSRPVEVVRQLDPAGDVFFFACVSPQGHRALRLHRSEQVQVAGDRMRASARLRDVESEAS